MARDVSQSTAPWRMRQCGALVTDADDSLEVADWEDGARYRVRTCDPYRVKVVLYH